MYATILLPDFRLQAVLRFASPELRREPVALIGPAEGRDAVLEVSPPAVQHGARAGMSPSQALARCPALRFVKVCAASESNTRDALLQVAWSLSPKVESQQEGICTADLRGGYRNPRRLLLEALQRLDTLYLRAKAGLAPTPDLALLAAQQGEPLLCIEHGAAFSASLPLSALTRDTILLQTLSRWGVHTAGDLLKLPRQQTLERLGSPGLALWKAAGGWGNRPLTHAQEPVCFEETLDLEQALETLEPLLFILNRLLEKLLARPECKALLVSGLDLKLLQENSSTYQRSFTVPSPTLDSAVLLRILQTHLEQLHLEHRPVGVRLRLETTAEKTCSLDLFEPVLRDCNRFGETLAKLCALLGEDRVGIPPATLAHFPNFARPAPPSELYKGPTNSLSSPTLSSPLPPPRGLHLHRLRPALPARIEFTGAQPVFIKSQTLSGKITASRGPYRLSGLWWDEKIRTLEEWDIFVPFRQGSRLKSALARIGISCARSLERKSTTKEWRLEGVYNLNP